MATIFDSHQGTWGENIDPASLVADGAVTFTPCFDGYSYPYRHDALSLAVARQGRGVNQYTLVNGNNVFSQVCMLLGFGACAYRLEDCGIFASVMQADVPTVNIVDGQEVERQHQAPIIHRFRPKKTDV
jgi:hypothetical protein